MELTFSIKKIPTSDQIIELFSGRDICLIRTTHNRQPFAATLKDYRQ
jgi:hypothetical protein